jgi:hypothetical protein
MGLLNNWQGNAQITTPQGVPLCSHGPTLAAIDDRLFMIYSGKGQNLWVSSSSASNLPAWGTNSEAVIASSGSVPRTDFRPAAAVLPNKMIHVVYEGSGGSNLWWSWFDGTTWYGNVSLPFTGSHLQPTLAVSGGKLHLVWHDEQQKGTLNGRQVPGHEYLWHSVYDPQLPLEVDSWKTPDLLFDGAEYPSLVAYNGLLYLLARNYPYGASPVPPGFMYGKWNTAGVFTGLKPVQITGSVPETSEGPTATVFGKYLVFVYQGSGGANLWYAYMDTEEQFFGNDQITTPTSTPRTSAVVGALGFNGMLCLAYKGESNYLSNNIYYAYASS